VRHRMTELRLTCSGIGKGVIGTCPPQSPFFSSPASHEPSSRKLPPRSAHKPYSTVYSPLTTPSTSAKPSQQISRRPSQNSSPALPPNALASPDALHSMLASVFESESPDSNHVATLPSSAWSFLDDSDYLHPLLAQPLLPSCHSLASSTGLLLKTAGLKVTAIKIDPYMNIDAGTMAPTEHGEVYVLNDGGETDLDLGNYERYLNVSLGKDNNVTTGKMYQHVIDREVSLCERLG